LFFEIVTACPLAALVMPVTADAPLEMNGSTMLSDTVVGPFDEPRVIPVIAAPPVRFEIVFADTRLVPALPLKFTLIPTMLPVGVAVAVQLLNVLFVIVFVGPFVADAPSVLTQPAIDVEPTTLMFEKSLRVFSIVDPFTEDAKPKNSVMLPLPLLLVNCVTIEFELTLSLPVAVMLLLLPRVMNVTDPVVLTVRFVNVLLLMFAAAELEFAQLM
jgi:hypothetical protein